MTLSAILAGNLKLSAIAFHDCTKALFSPTIKIIPNGNYGKYNTLPNAQKKNISRYLHNWETPTTPDKAVHR